MSMPVEAIVAFRKRHKLSQRGLAELVKVNTATVERWEKRETEPPGMLELALEALDRRLGAAKEAVAYLEDDLQPVVELLKKMLIRREQQRRR